MRIKFQDRYGNLSFDPPGVPVVEVCINFDNMAHSGKRVVPIIKKFVALIDTGASICCIDPSVLIANDLPLAGEMLISGVNGTITESHHMGHILFPEEKIQFETDLVTSPLRSQDRKYDAIIGMVILQESRLILDYFNRDFRLEFK